MCKTHQRAHPRCHIALLAMLFFTVNVALAGGRHDIVARSGEQAPDTPAGTLFTGFHRPILNNNGQVAYRALLQTGVGGVLVRNNSGIWLDNALIVRAGSHGPGTPDGAVFSRFESAILNDNGQITYTGLLRSGEGGGITSRNNIGIWRDNTLIVREGFQASGTPDGAVYTEFFSDPFLNNNGQVTYRGLLRPGEGGVTTNNRSGIWRDNTLIARQGSQALGTPTGTLYSGFSQPVMNDNGQVTYSGFLKLGVGGVTLSNNTSIWRDNTLIAREGSHAPGTPSGTLYSDLDLFPVVNNNGQVAYWAGLQPSVGDGYSSIWLDNTLIVRGGSQAPGTPAGALFAGFRSHVLNNNGQLAYVASLQSGTGGVTSGNSSGIWRDNTLVARAGFQAPGTPDGTLYTSFRHLMLNDNGQVAYISHLSGGGLPGPAGIWLNGVNGDTILAVREGDVVEGKTIRIVDTNNLNVNYQSAFNNFSQIAYIAFFTDGTQGIVRYTPDLHWFSSTGGDWDSNLNWTIAQAPGKVHDVFIDPSTNITVTGSSNARTVKHLTIGGGIGISTLSLNGGNLTALNGVDIGSNGVLTGTGIITGQVINRGEIALVNNESLRLTQGGHSNNGRVTVTDSRLTVDGGFTNNTIGRIQGRNAILEFNGGLNNSGQLQLTGTTDIFGKIINNTGSLINSANDKVTYFDKIVNNGELRTHNGSESIFKSEYTGTGVLTGTGLNQFEGGFSPGASSFLATATTDVTFGSTNITLIELAGSERGLGSASEYDGLDILEDQTLTLGGILDVVLLDDLTPGYSPSLDEMFIIFTAGLIDGSFNTINLPTLELGLDWIVENDGQKFSLTVGAAVVPLPAGIWLFLTGMAGLITFRRSKR